MEQETEGTPPRVIDQLPARPFPRRKALGALSHVVVDHLPHPCALIRAEPGLTVWPVPATEDTTMGQQPPDRPPVSIRSLSAPVGSRLRRRPDIGSNHHRLPRGLPLIHRSGTVTSDLKRTRVDRGALVGTRSATPPNEDSDHRSHATPGTPRLDSYCRWAHSIQDAALDPRTQRSVPHLLVRATSIPRRAPEPGRVRGERAPERRSAGPSMKTGPGSMGSWWALHPDPLLTAGDQPLPRQERAPWVPGRGDADPGRLLVTVPGGTYDRSYWDTRLPQDDAYSFADVATVRGWLVLLLDNVGTGASFRPADSGSVTVAVMADAVAQAHPGGLGPDPGRRGSRPASRVTIVRRRGGAPPRRSGRRHRAGPAHPF